VIELLVVEVMEFIETERGNQSVIYKGYTYRRIRENKKGEVTWLCLKERSIKCKGKLVTRENDEEMSFQYYRS
jgi:hypothetical protein